jgi:hypothetical protein
VPIPLTRLHTPRPRFRSAMDLSAYVPGASPEHAVRETSSTTLPPLVASLPPASPPLYVPGPSSALRFVQARAIAAWAAAFLGAVGVLVGGVAVGRRLVGGGDEPALHVLAPASQSQRGRDRDEEKAAAVAPPSESTLPALAGATQTTPTLAIEPTPVEALPRASAAQPAHPATPYVRPMPAPPPRLPAPVPNAARAEGHGPDVSSVAAAGATSAPLTQRPAEKDMPASEGRRAVAAPTQGATETPPAPAATAEPEVDPLVRAVRDDIAEEESRRK